MAPLVLPLAILLALQPCCVAGFGLTNLLPSNNDQRKKRLRFLATRSNEESSSSVASTFEEIARGGQAELLLSHSSVSSYFEPESRKGKLLRLANQCRHSYLTTGIAHIPQFVRLDLVDKMVEEAINLQQREECFYSTEDHTVYQEPNDSSFAQDHPRNALQRSSKWIIDFDRIDQESSPLAILYKSPELKAFVSYVVRSDSESKNDALYTSGCPYNAAYYNIYEPNDGLGWHFDKSQFGVNLELQPGELGGDFELCWNTREDDSAWCFDKVQNVLDVSDDAHSPVAQRIQDPPVGPGSLVFFAGARNLHRVTPVVSQKPRINAIMTFETQPNQRPNAYSLKKFFGR